MFRTIALVKITACQALALSWDFTRKKKLARATLLKTIAVFVKLYIPPTLEYITNKNKKGYDRLLLKR